MLVVKKEKKIKFQGKNFFPPLPSAQYVSISTYHVSVSRTNYMILYLAFS